MAKDDFLQRKMIALWTLVFGRLGLNSLLYVWLFGLFKPQILYLLNGGTNSVCIRGVL